MKPDVHPALASHLPAGGLLTGRQGLSSPRALFVLLLADPRAATAVRHWLGTPFLTDLLPSLLNSVERRVADLLRGVFR